MKSLTILVLAATSFIVIARALPNDYSPSARDTLPQAEVFANDARATPPTTVTTLVTVTASKLAATKTGRGKAGSVTHSSAAATSTRAAAAKGGKGKAHSKDHRKDHHKGHGKHGLACNATIAAGNATNVALNSTLAASNCTLTALNSTSTLFNITAAARPASNITAVTPKKHSTVTKVAESTKAKPTALPDSKSIDAISEALTAHDQPTANDFDPIIV